MPELAEDVLESPWVENAQNDFLAVVQDLTNKSDWRQVTLLTTRFIALRPKVGLAYFFRGYALNETKQYPYAMEALAKCCALKLPASTSAKALLEKIYKITHQGSTAGLDELLKQAKYELSKLPDHRGKSTV